MWTTEHERLGFKRCTPVGYALVSAAYLLLVGGGLGTAVMGAFLLMKAFSKAGIPPEMWTRGFLALGLTLGCMLAGWLSNWLGREIARRRGFVHDYQTDTCRWEGGGS